MNARLLFSILVFLTIPGISLAASPLLIPGTSCKPSGYAANTQACVAYWPTGEIKNDCANPVDVICPIPRTAGTTIWAVSISGLMPHKTPVESVKAQLVWTLRDHYGLCKEAASPTPLPADSPYGFFLPACEDIDQASPEGYAYIFTILVRLPSTARLIHYDVSASDDLTAGWPR